MSEKVYTIRYDDPKSSLHGQYWKGGGWSNKIKKFYRITELKLAIKNNYLARNKDTLNDDPIVIEEYDVVKSRDISLDEIFPK